MAGKATMSAEAQKFLDDVPGSDYPSLESADMVQVRADIRAEFEPASQRAIERHKVTTTEAEVAGVPCMVVQPVDGEPQRTVLYSYGGGYVTGSPFEDLPITAALADHLNARVIAAHYRLAPENPFPAAVDDAWQVYRHVSETCKAGSWVLAGESAGGNLTLALLQKARQEGCPLPVAAALLSPWCDLANEGDSTSFNAGRDPTLHPVFLHEAGYAYAGGRDVNEPGISPINGEFDASMPPVIITTGTRDLLMSQVVRLHRVMREAGIDADLRVWDGLWHVFEFYDELPEAALSLKEVADFLDLHLDGDNV